MAAGYIQAALEQAPNSENSTNKVSTTVFYLPGTSIEIDPDMTVLERGDELRGGFYQAPHAGAAEYAPKHTINSRMYPAVMGLYLCLLCGGVTTTQGDGGSVKDPAGVSIPADAYRHVFSWKTGDVPQTAQLIACAPDGGAFWKLQGVGANQMTFSRDGGAWVCEGELLSLVAKTISDPSLTPAYEAAKPWRAGQMTLSWLNSTAVTEDFEWKIDNGLTTEYQMSDPSIFPDSIVYEENLPVLGGTIDKRSFKTADWNALEAGTQFNATMHWTHSESATGTYKHQLWVECPGAQYVSGKPDAIENKRRNKASFEWAARQDSVTGEWAKITLVNATPTYAVYP